MATATSETTVQTNLHPCRSCKDKEVLLQTLVYLQHLSDHTIEMSGNYLQCANVIFVGQVSPSCWLEKL